MPQYIILKADDVRRDPEHILPLRWQTFIARIETYGIQAALGVIGNSLEGDHPAYFDRLKTLHHRGRFELWNHGYDHVLNGTNNRGESYCEFSNTSLEHQRDHLVRTQGLAREKLGITLRTFGAPGNRIDDATRIAIDGIDDIEVWLYGPPQSKKRVLRRSTNIEYPTHNPDFAQFLAHDQPDPEYLVLQVHPNSWDENRLSQFDQIIRHLIARNCVFTLPHSYHKHLS